jgi:arsenate reductase (thioredoxin)
MRYVLFVCTHNAGRSQMAQASFERLAPIDLRAESAGQEPSDAIWPNLVEAMREVGIDISDRKPKKIDREMQLHADKAITLNCQESCPYVVGGVEDWEVDDPAGKPIEQVREIRADRSGHQRRLAQLLPSLAAEFEATKSPEEIRACNPGRVRRRTGALVCVDACPATRSRVPQRTGVRGAGQSIACGGESSV